MATLSNGLFDKAIRACDVRHSQCGPTFTHGGPSEAGAVTKVDAGGSSSWASLPMPEASAPPWLGRSLSCQLIRVDRQCHVEHRH